MGCGTWEVVLWASSSPPLLLSSSPPLLFLFLSFPFLFGECVSSFVFTVSLSVSVDPPGIVLSILSLFSLLSQSGPHICGILTRLTVLTLTETDPCFTVITFPSINITLAGPCHSSEFCLL